MCGEHSFAVGQLLAFPGEQSTADCQPSAQSRHAEQCDELLVVIDHVPLGMGWARWQRPAIIMEWGPSYGVRLSKPTFVDRLCPEPFDTPCWGRVRAPALAD